MIPMTLIIFGDGLPVAKNHFNGAKFYKVEFSQSILSTFIMEMYILSIIIFLVISRSNNFLEIKNNKLPKIKILLVLYILINLFVFFNSDLLSGGHWYSSRKAFMHDLGQFGVLLTFFLFAIKLAILASYFHLFKSKAYGFKKALLYIFSFGIFDMLISGNRILVFICFFLFLFLLIEKNPIKYLKRFPFVLLILVFGGYLASIFTFVRNRLYNEGFPTPQYFLECVTYAFKIEPFQPRETIIGMTEAVNVNVVYEIFNSYNDLLYGASYLKPFVFIIPRSVWADKPESITTIAANQFSGSPSLATTMIGEMHMNFSLFGLVLLPVFLFFINYFSDKVLSKLTKIKNLILFLFAVLYFRMAFSDIFLIFIILVILLFFLNLKFTFNDPNKK